MILYKCELNTFFVLFREPAIKRNMLCSVLLQNCIFIFIVFYFPKNFKVNMCNRTTYNNIILFLMQTSLGLLVVLFPRQLQIAKEVFVVGRWESCVSLDIHLLYRIIGAGWLGCISTL